MDLLFFHWQLFPSEIISRSFDIGREESLGTWVSVSLALFTGLVAAAVAGTCRFHRERAAITFGWVIVALFFLFVSFDDAAKFHERVGTAMRVKVERVSDVPLISWFPSWGWQVYVMPLFATVGAYLAWFFWRTVPARVRYLPYVGFGFLAVAVGIDFYEGVLDREEAEINHLMRLVEETLEMIGTTAFLYTFLTTLSQRVGLTLRFVDPPK